MSQPRPLSSLAGPFSRERSLSSSYPRVRRGDRETTTSNLPTTLSYDPSVSKVSRQKNAYMAQVRQVDSVTVAWAQLSLRSRPSMERTDSENTVKLPSFRMISDRSGIKPSRLRASLAGNMAVTDVGKLRVSASLQSSVATIPVEDIPRKGTDLKNRSGPSSIRSATNV